MKSLSSLLGDVRKNVVIKLFLGNRESYVGQVLSLDEYSFVVSSFSDDGSRRFKIDYTHPEINGREIKGYELLFKERKSVPTERVIEHVIPIREKDIPVGGFGGPFRNSLDRELIEAREKEEARIERQRKKEEEENFGRPMFGGGFGDV